MIEAHLVHRGGLTDAVMVRRALVILFMFASLLAVPARWPAALASEQSVVSRDGVEIRYRSAGVGEPVLVFVHCWTCTQRFWDAQVRHFAQQRRVVTLDLGGHGISAAGRREWTIEAFAEDVVAVVRKLGSRRVVLIGHSMGGPVILEAAHRMPNRVTALVPVDTLHDVDRPVIDKAAKESTLAEMRADYRGYTARFLRETMFVASTPPQVIARVVASATAMRPAVAISAIAHATEHDPRPALRGIKAPIHAINSDKWPTDVTAARRYAPQYRLSVIRGVGHYPMLEAPQRFNAILEEVLNSLP
jgi:pimeloyl-ACP methyl ester carboxylesterase